MTPIRCRIEDDVPGPALDAPFEHGLQRLIGGVVGIEGEIVAEEDEILRPAPQQSQKVGQGRQILAVNLDERQRTVDIPGDCRMDSLYQGALAHAPGAPEEGVVGGQAGSEPACVLK